MKKKSKYILKNREFATFKAMKTYAYYNMRTGEKIKGYELTIDEILKEYELIKQEGGYYVLKLITQSKNTKN